MISIDFDKPVIPEDHILAITPGDIDDQYVVSSERERFNLFFVLLTTFHACKDGNKMVLAAHMAYLLSYYLFVALTPPGSEELALHYAKQARKLNPSPFYTQWYDFVRTGN